MEAKDVIAQLIKNGAKEIKGVVVKNVTVTPMDEYIRLGLTLNKEVDGYRVNDNDEYEEAKTKIVFVSAFTIAALLKESDDAAFAANHLVKHPDALAMIMSRATITIVQERVKAETEYKNPFASETAETTVFDHDTIINHVTEIKLSDFGLKRLDRLADLMLGVQ